jgi:hypothetical protein
MIQVITSWIARPLNKIALQPETIDAPQYLKEGQEVGILINTENDQVLALNFLIK